MEKGSMMEMGRGLDGGAKCVGGMVMEKEVVK